MSAAQYLRDLLRPLGVYDLTAPFNGGELDAAGLELDEAEELLEEIQRETCLATAESWGPEKWASLFVQRPIAAGGQELAAACCASAGTALPWRTSTALSPAAASPPR